MALEPGARLGPYEIVSPAGAGGMGEVYRARDTRLDRTVAIKVLPPDLTSDSAARQRFEREARAVAALSHPHICTLHDIGHQDGTDYLVMEFLDGETLAQRLTRGKLPPDQALQYGIQIADALGAAHKAGIVHRDLKPGNVMLTKSGAKLLDFGLAKPREHGGLTGQTMTTAAEPLTSRGTILGTLQYMAPEQLAGAEADARTDIFAFGALLYEMLTGRRAFNGDTQAALIGNILSVDPPPPSSLTPVETPTFDRVLQICLAKDPERRWSSARDLSLQLQLLLEARSVHSPVADRPRRRRRVGVVTLSAAAIVALAVIAVQIARNAASVQRRGPVQFVLTEPPGVTWRVFAPPAVSPDGQYVAAFGADGDGIVRLYIRSLQTLSAHAVPETSRELIELAFWSADSRFIGFADGRKLKRAAVAGGSPKVICDLPDEQLALATWNHENSILFGSFSGPLRRVNATGGTPEAVTTLDSRRGETGHLFPWFLPDGKGYLFLTAVKDRTSLYAAHLDSSERVLLKELRGKGAGEVEDVPWTAVMYVDMGYLVFQRATQLMLQRFDPATFKLSGPEVPVELSLPVWEFSVAPMGTLTYTSQDRRSEALPTDGYLAVIDRAGREMKALSPLGGYFAPRVSPDDKTVVVTRFDEENPGDLWVFEIRRGVGTRVSFDPDPDSAPAWLASSNFLLSTRSKRDAFGMRAGSGTVVATDISRLSAERIVQRATTNQYGPWVMDVSADGRYMLLLTDNEKSRGDLDAFPLSGGQAIPVARSRFDEHQARFSADGRWVAYSSDESGRPEVYVEAFPPTGKKTLVSTAGGYQPSWRQDGRELFYLTADRMLMSVDVHGITNLECGIPKALFKAPVAEPNYGRNHYDPFADGQRFVVHVVKPEALRSARLVVALDSLSPQ